MEEYLSDKITDEALENLEEKLKLQYAKVYAELKLKAERYFDKYKERYEKEHAAYLAGKYTKTQFDAWVKNQIMRGQRYERLRDDAADRIVKANEIAAAYINKDLPKIAAENYNYEFYRAEIIGGNSLGASFQLMDENSIMNLMTGENHIEFRTVRHNPKRDYAWNTERINSALVSGIGQGKDINQLANSFLNVMGGNQAAAMRNARTAYTSAQNGGRQTGFNRLGERGVEFEKEWISTLDKKTRDSHRHLDGERVRYDDTFTNGLEYPGDPDGEPSEVYNCRCTVRSVFEGVNDESRITYYDWLKENGEEDEP